MTAPASPSSRPSRMGLRLLAGLLAVALLLPVAYAGVVTLFVGAVTIGIPNAYDVEGEWASTPNDWGAAITAVLSISALSLLVALGLSLVVALVWFAIRNKAVRWRPALLVPAAFGSLVLLALGGALFAGRGDALPATDCGDFDFDRAALAATQRARWEPQARGLVDCGDIANRTSAEVRAMLGEQPSLTVTDGDLSLHGGALTIPFSDGRAYSPSYDHTRGGSR